MTPVKICGLTRPADVALARDLGAAFLGFNFSARSPRRVDAENGPSLLEASGGTRRVGIFVDEEPAAVRAAIAALRLDFLQFHRDLRESDFQFGLPVVAVCRVSAGPPGSSVSAAVVLPPLALRLRCRAILFDTADPEKAGGTGAVFDWEAIRSVSDGVPVGIAGGLTAENVGAAIRAVRPAFVDVASGVESAAGIKDPGKLESFFTAVSHAG